MKRDTLEQTRDFFSAMVGKGKPFRSRVALADYLGMNEPSKRTKFCAFLNGSDPSFRIVSDWIERAGGKVILPDMDPAVYGNFRLVPKVAAVAGAGATLETSEEVLGFYAFRADWFRQEHINEKQSVLMDVRGDSMEPLLKNGDTMLVDQSDTEIMDGRIYVVTLGDELRVKRCQKALRGYVLRSENPRYADIPVVDQDLEMFRVHGRVRWTGKMI